MTPPPFQAYYRVWLAKCQTPDQHAAFHAAVWSGKERHAVRLLTEAAGDSPAADADREAVAAHVAADWQNARVLASMASACTVWESGEFAARVKSLRGAAGLTVPALAERAGLLAATLRMYEAGTRRPGWDAVQALAAALGVTTDTFRDKPA